MKAAVLQQAAMAAGAFLLLSLSLPAQTLLIDFGPTADATDNSAGLNPANIGGGIWNKSAADLNSGVLYADGSAATGVYVDVGSDNSSTTSVKFSSGVSTLNGSAAAFTTGVFAGTSPARDVIFASGTGVGVNIGGLAAGTYNVYISAALTNTATPAAATLYAGAVASSSVGQNSATPFTFTSLASLTESNATAGISSAWNAGQNYVEFTNVTLGAGDNLVIAGVNGTSTIPLNMVEIVAVPEPSTLAFLGAGALGLLLLARRRAVLA